MKHEKIETLFFCKSKDFLEVYIPKQRNGSDNTKATYKCGMKKFRTYVNNVAGIHTNKFKFEDCTYDFLLDYRNYLHDNQGLSETTVNNRLAVVKSYMQYVSARDISLQQYAFAISQVPFYSVPRIMQPIIESEDALAALLSMPPNTKKGLRDKVIMSILYDGGLRLSELVSLKIRNLDIVGGNIRIMIHGKGNKERTDIMDSKTSALITQYLDEYHQDMNQATPLIYTVIDGTKKSMSTRNVQKLIKKYADKVRETYELPDSVSPHTLRRTRGTLLYRDGVELQDIAIKFGHSSTQTTRSHYTSPSQDQLRAIANKRADAIPDADPIWPDDEDEMRELLGF